MENWLPVVDWEGIYEVSDLGRVRRVIGGRGTNAGHLMGAAKRSGYALVRLRYMGRTRQVAAHILVMEAFVGPRPRKWEINHLNGVRDDNRLLNLEYCTVSGNKLHSYAVLNRAKVCCKGLDNGRAKLTEEQVRDIRARYKGRGRGISQQKLADEYGVNQTMIGFIVRRVSWPHLA